MLRDNLVGLIEPMLSSAGAYPLALCTAWKQSSDDRPPCLENPRPEGAESTLTENAPSPFHAEPKHIDLVVVKGATKRTRQPRSLTVDEFRKFVQLLEEPFRTMALLCVCFGLRISECLALKWCDVDWLNGKLRIERGIVRQHVDDVKTIYSQKQMNVDGELLAILKAWKQTTQFPADGDWLFASPVQLGRLPWSYPQILRVFHRAAEHAGIGKLPTHTLRHSYRSWLDAVGTPIAVQQKLMRHTDIRTTMNLYGDVVTDEMAQAHSKVVGLALSNSD